MLILLGVMAALGKIVHVIERGGEKRKIRLAVLPRNIGQQTLQHFHNPGKRMMLLPDGRRRHLECSHRSLPWIESTTSILQRQGVRVLMQIKIEAQASSALSSRDFHAP
jgi:hypothetical protein